MKWLEDDTFYRRHMPFRRKTWNHYFQRDNVTRELQLAVQILKKHALQFRKNTVFLRLNIKSQPLSKCTTGLSSGFYFALRMICECDMK